MTAQPKEFSPVDCSQTCGADFSECTKSGEIFDWLLRVEAARQAEDYSNDTRDALHAEYRALRLSCAMFRASHPEIVLD